MKVLISAYACEPDKGSEPGVGWNLAVQLSRFHEVWVITRQNNRNSIEHELSCRPKAKLHFIYVDPPKSFSFWKKGQRGIYPYYVLWQLWAYWKAKRLHATEGFDLVHHLTFGTVLLPTFMTFLNIPFIWGPIGGAEAVPKILRQHFILKWKAYEKLRDLIIKLTFSLNPLSRLAMKKAKLIIARTKITRDAFSSKIREKTILMIETGVSREFLNEMKTTDHSDATGIVLMVGRLLHPKGFDIGIEAFLKICGGFPKVRLVIVGTGTEKERLKLLANRDAVGQKRISFMGRLSREETLKMMREADVFLMPNMKEAGAWVLYEAMASSLPVVCLDYAGPGEIVDASCAYSIPVGERTEVIQKIANALSELLSSEKLRKSMGEASIRRLEDNFLWENKAETINEFYGRVIDFSGKQK